MRTRPAKPRTFCRAVLRPSDGPLARIVAEHGPQKVTAAQVSEDAAKLAAAYLPYRPKAAGR